jgi:hypothetical protein
MIFVRPDRSSRLSRLLSAGSSAQSVETPLSGAHCLTRQTMPGLCETYWRRCRLQLDLSDEDDGEPAFEDARRVRYSPQYQDAVACSVCRNCGAAAPIPGVGRSLATSTANEGSRAITVDLVLAGRSAGACCPGSPLSRR